MNAHKTPVKLHIILVLVATLTPVAYVSSAAAATCPVAHNLQGTSLGSFCLGAPPACPANTNCIDVTDPNHGDTGWCTIADAVNMISSSQKVDQCVWVRALNTSYPYAILLPGSYTGNNAPKPPVIYVEPEQLWVGFSEPYPSIAITGTGAANSEIELANASGVGGIFMDTGSLNNLTLTGWPGTNYPGGSCVDISATVTLNSVTINNCTATGLIVEAFGTATVNGSTISNNVASPGHPNSLGGGIRAYDANLVVNNSTISGNSTPDEGAGIAMFGGTLTMTGSAVENNVSGANGGGISFDVGEGGIISSTVGQGILYSSITGNSALSGGGIAVIEGQVWDEADSLGGLQWDTISTNKATNGYGGGIWDANSCDDPCGLSGEHDTVVYNTSTKGGGGVYIVGGNSPITPVEWDGSIFAYNKTNNVADDYDGAIRTTCEEFTDGADSNLVQASTQSGGVAKSAGWNCGPISGFPPGNPQLNTIGDVAGDPLLNAVLTAKNGTQYYSPKPNSPAISPGGQPDATTFLKSEGDTADQIGDKAPANGSYYCLGSIEVVSSLPTGCASGATIFSETSCSSFPSFNTTGAVCFKVKVSTVNGWNASNVLGRTATAKGATTQGPITPTNGTIANQPGLSAGSDGYVYFNFTAGSYSYASMTCW